MREVNRMLTPSQATRVHLSTTRAPPDGCATCSHEPRLSALHDFYGRKWPLPTSEPPNSRYTISPWSSDPTVLPFLDSTVQIFLLAFRTSRLRGLKHPTLALSSYETPRCEIPNSDLFRTAPTLTALQLCKIQRLSVVRHFYLEVSLPSVSSLFCARLDVHFRRPRSISLQLI
jgi:hypothetical protein